MKATQQWVSSAFDGFSDFPVSQQKGEHSHNGKSLSELENMSKPVERTHGITSYSKDDFFKERTVTLNAKRLSETILWSERYAPECRVDLAVHKKKIAEVEQWLIKNLHKKQCTPILLLTGPAGVGKTVTVRVLVKELNHQLHEWTNPLAADAAETYTLIGDTDWRSSNHMEAGISSSQLAQFQEFLLRANKYNMLDIFGGGIVTGKVIMVEDFPNTFYRDATPFHDLLRRYAQVRESPLIFIVSDSTSGDSNERWLFPKELQAELSIEKINFNPIAMSSMRKTLSKVAAMESARGSQKFTVPSVSVIESIAVASAGDVRAAINALQFACLKDTGKMSSVSSSKTKAKVYEKSSTPATRTGTSKSTLKKTYSSHLDDELISIGGRDTSLFLFRALGKILYSKRAEPSGETDVVALPRFLSQYYRDPLQVNPEDVVQRSHISCDLFGTYLHQNYVDFFPVIEDVVSASEYFSDADYLTFNWASRSASQEYAISVAARGIMFSNSSNAHYASGGAGLGWKPLHKPLWFFTSKQARQNSESARFLFSSYLSPPVVLQTEIIPYMALMDVTFQNRGQMSFMQNMCKYSSSQVERYENLDEKDVDLEDESVASLVSVDNDRNLFAVSGSVSSNIQSQSADYSIGNSQANGKSLHDLLEEEYVIEEYDN